MVRQMCTVRAEDRISHIELKNTEIEQGMFTEQKIMVVWSYRKDERKLFPYLISKFGVQLDDNQGKHGVKLSGEVKVCKELARDKNAGKSCLFNFF